MSNTSTVERLENCEVKLTMNVSAEQLEEGIQAAFLKIRDRIHVPGFRKGRAPRKVVEATYGKEVFYDDGINEVLPEIYEAALEEHVLDVVSRPMFEAPEIDRDTGAVIEAKFFVKPEIVLTDYMGLKYKPPLLEATDEEVDFALSQELAKNARAVSVEGRPVENGDTAIIDFEGFVDGVPFEGGKGVNHELKIGSKSFIDTFEDQIIGKNIGDEFDVFVTFPTPYSSADLEGKDAVFKVRVNGIDVAELPELDDEFAQEVSEFETLQEYKDDIKATIEKNKQENAEAEIEGQIILELIKQLDETNIFIPDDMYETEMDNQLRDFSRRLSFQGMNLEQYMNYMGLTYEILRESFRANAVNNVKGRLALEAAAKNENFDVTEDELSAELDRMAVEYRIERDKIEEEMGKREIELLKKDIRVKKTVKKITENAVAEE